MTIHPQLFAKHLRTSMNILKRLSELPVDDLCRLQREVLGEIHRRKELAQRNCITTDSSAGPGQTRGSEGPSTPLPDAPRPDQKRRAA